MAFTADYEILSDRLDEELRQAPRAAPDLFAKIIGCVCTRVSLLDRSGKAGRVDRLLQAGAWADAAMALIELELPAWTLRRAVYEDGEWLCSLSRQPNLPLEFDDTVDARHEKLPLAILRAFVEARSRSESMKTSGVPLLPRDHAGTLCCDNFA
jgi:hypothetical protein